MLPLHLQTMFSASSCSVDIVADNAKTHVSQQGARRRSSAPSGAGTIQQSSPRRSARCRSLQRSKSDPPATFSRWESEVLSPTKKHDCAPCLKIRTSVQVEEQPNSLHNVLKPVRRQSIDDPEVLAQLHDSLGNLGGDVDETKSTAALLAMALESLDLFEDEL